MSDLVWTNEKRKLSQLIPWPRNPRQIKIAEGERLAQSLNEFGQPEPIVIGPGDELYNGHQRLKVWAQKFGDITVDVRVASRPLTEKEREKLTVYLHRGAMGEWDFDALSEWDAPDLVEWGFSPYELGLGGNPNDPSEHWRGMPEFEHEDKTDDAAFIIRVFLNNAEELAELGRLLGKDLTGRKFVWFSRQPHPPVFEAVDA